MYYLAYSNGTPLHLTSLVSILLLITFFCWRQTASGSVHVHRFEPTDLWTRSYPFRSPWRSNEWTTTCSSPAKTTTTTRAHGGTKLYRHFVPGPSPTHSPLKIFKPKPPGSYEIVFLNITRNDGYIAMINNRKQNIGIVCKPLIELDCKSFWRKADKKGLPYSEVQTGLIDLREALSFARS